MENSDMSTGTVGKPMTGLEVKLVDWEEGSYRTSDKPRPRGKTLLYFDVRQVRNGIFSLSFASTMLPNTKVKLGNFQEKANKTFNLV